MKVVIVGGVASRTHMANTANPHRFNLTLS